MPVVAGELRSSDWNAPVAEPTTTDSPNRLSDTTFPAVFIYLNRAWQCQPGVTVRLPEGGDISRAIPFRWGA